DPLEAALSIQLALLERGLIGHLERSKGGSGWHVWVFFSSPAPAALVREALLPLVPKDLPLRDGSRADAASNRGIEGFPKSAVCKQGGWMVFLPWWAGAPDGCCQFHRGDDDGTLAPYAPADLAVTPAGRLEALRPLLRPAPAPAPPPARSGPRHDGT